MSSQTRWRLTFWISLIVTIFYLQTSPNVMMGSTGMREHLEPLTIGQPTEIAASAKERIAYLGQGLDAWERYMHSLAWVFVGWNVWLLLMVLLDRRQQRKSKPAIEN